MRCHRLELQQLVNRHNTAQQIVLRAKIILLASEGKNHGEIARTLDISLDMARLWRNRWCETSEKELSILQRLQDLERIGAPVKFSMEQFRRQEVEGRRQEEPTFKKVGLN